MSGEYTGVLDSVPSLLNYTYDTVCGREDVEIPTEYILPKDRIPDCRDQKKTNTCVPHAITGVMQILYYIESDEWEQFSPTFVTAACRPKEQRTMKSSVTDTALNYLTKIGCCFTKDLPEIMENPEAFDYVYAHPELFEKANEHKLGWYAEFTGSKEDKIEQIKEAIIRFQIPVVAVVKEKTSSHAIDIIGWNDAQGRFIVMNSWGDRGGAKGVDSYSYKDFKRGYLIMGIGNTDINLMPFEDVNQDKWYYKAIKHMYNAGLVRGTSDNAFEPERNMTRAEFTQGLYNLCIKQDEENKALSDRIAELEEIVKKLKE